MADVLSTGSHFVVRPGLIDIRIIELLKNLTPCPFIYGVDLCPVPGQQFAHFHTE
jgi:hypothetical protein